MALKGTTRIELTNVKTGEKEVYEKHNLVTNAVASILDNLFAWQLKSTYSSQYFAANILPLCPNLFGGILLYHDSIPENVDQLYAQSTNKLVGYSSNNANSKTDIMRGSMNLNESGALESNDGYRFVFDFTTAQANGTISAVGLTSKWGGMAGYGSTEWANTQSPTVFYQQTDSITDIGIGYAYMNLLHYDAETGIATSMYYSGKNTIVVTRIRLHTKNWKLTRSLSLADATQVLEVQYIETKVFGTTVASNASSAYGKQYYNFCNSGDGYVWGFEHKGNAEGNSSGNASINWIKIKLEDLTFEEGTWEIGAQLYSMGRHRNEVGTSTKYCANDQSNSVILDGYLYCFNYQLTGVYKINLSNITDIEFIEHPSKQIAVYSTTSSTNPHFYFYGVGNITVQGNKVCLWNGWINVDEIVRNAYTDGNNARYDGSLNDGWIDTSDNGVYPQRNSSGHYGVDIGAFRFVVNGIWYTAYNYATLYGRILLDAPYLATINNLPTPVQKTADKTMKITYILREES